MIYFVNIFLLMIEGIWLLGYLPQRQTTLAAGMDVSKKIRSYEKIFCILASVQWILISGLRHKTIGADTAVYLDSFQNASRYTFSYLKENFINVLFRGGAGKDPGFLYFEKLSNLFLQQNGQLYLIVIALLFFIPLGYFIYRNSSEPFSSFLLFSCLFYAFFAITGIRQTIATSFTVLVGYGFVKKRKLIPFLILLLIMATVHKSCLIFLIFYFWANKKITARYSLLMLTAVPVIFLFKTQIKIILVRLTGYEDYLKNYEGAGTYTFTFLLLAILLVALWRKKRILERNPQAVHYFNALFLALLFVPITFINPSAMRVVQYFSIFLMLLIPEIIMSFEKKERVFTLFCISAVLIALFARDAPVYQFFWQG